MLALGIVFKGSVNCNASNCLCVRDQAKKNKKLINNDDQYLK